MDSSVQSAIASVLDQLDRPAGLVREDESFEPLNQRMRSLLERSVGIGDRGSWRELPFTDQERAVIEASLGRNAPPFAVHASFPADGEREPLTIHGVRLGGAGGEWLWVFESDGPLQRAEAELRRLHRLRSVGQALHGFVHDLNNALGSVMGLGALLARKLTDPAETRLLDGVTSAATKASDLLRFVGSFVAAGPRQLTKIELAEYVDMLRVAILGQARNAGVEVQSRIVDPQLVVWGPRAELAQLLIQLLAHAVETAGGQPVDIDASESGRHVAVEIRVAGDERSDAGLAALCRTPQEGVSADRIASFRGNALAFVQSWFCLLLSGGSVEVTREDDRRVFRVSLLKAGTTGSNP